MTPPEPETDDDIVFRRIPSGFLQHRDTCALRADMKHQLLLEFFALKQLIEVRKRSDTHSPPQRETIKFFPLFRETLCGCCIEIALQDSEMACSTTGSHFRGAMALAWH